MHAWVLIEKARDKSQQESHNESRKLYEESCDILSNLPNYRYEAKYYSSWILQEDAEYLSKQEDHQKAIESFRETIERFTDSIEKTY